MSEHCCDVRCPNCGKYFKINRESLQPGRIDAVCLYCGADWEIIISFYEKPKYKLSEVKNYINIEK